MNLTSVPNDTKRTVRILIVEDEPIVALSLEDDLIEAGFQIAGVTGKLNKALALIESGACDLAIVDANLAGESASPVAAALVARGLPFIVTSGYSFEQLQGVFSGAVFVQKPCRLEMLLRTLNTLLLDRESVTQK